MTDPTHPEPQPLDESKVLEGNACSEPLDEAAIRARHIPAPRYFPSTEPWCIDCGFAYPCTPIQLLDALAEERALRVEAEQDRAYIKRMEAQEAFWAAKVDDAEARAEAAEREVARLKEAARIVTELLADMHDGCNDGNDWAPQPEKCMACLAFDESGIADLLAAAPGGLAERRAGRGR